MLTALPPSLPLHFHPPFIPAPIPAPYLACKGMHFSTSVLLASKGIVCASGCQVAWQLEHSQLTGQPEAWSGLGHAWCMATEVRHTASEPNRPHTYILHLTCGRHCTALLHYPGTAMNCTAHVLCCTAPTHTASPGAVQHVLGKCADLGIRQRYCRGRPACMWAHMSNMHACMSHMRVCMSDMPCHHVGARAHTRARYRNMTC